jgi:hypothetical protein
MASAARNHALIAGGLFFLALVPLLATPVLPLIDFYNHLARFYVLAHVGSDPLLAANYRAHWSLVPDIGLDVAATPILWLLPPLVAGHVIAVLIMAVIYGGVLYFHRALTGERSLLVAVLLLPLLYSYVMNWGFAPFLFALGLAFLAAGWWLDHRARPRTAVPVASLFALLLFLAHGVAFALYGILLASLEVGFFLTASRRDWRELIRGLAQLAVQAVVPVLLFLDWYHNEAFGKSLLSSSGFSPYAYFRHFIPRPGHTGLRRLATILRVEEGPAYWFDIATFVLQALALLLLIRLRAAGIVRPAWFLIAAATALILLVPQMMFSVDYVADRTPLFAAFCVLGGLAAGKEVWRERAAIASVLLTAIVLARIGVIAFHWHGYNRDYRQYRTLAARIPRGSLAMGIAVGQTVHETDVPRCEMYGPLLTPLYSQIGPLFDFRGQHPLILAGRLKKAENILESNPATVTPERSDHIAYMKAAAAAGFDYFLVCNRGLLTEPFPREFNLVAETPRFALLRVQR